jgi:hypothetical protein
MVIRRPAGFAASVRREMKFRSFAHHASCPVIFTLIQPSL